MAWIDNQSELSHTIPTGKTKNRKTTSSASTVRYAYPVYQGTSKILLQRAQKYFALCALDWLDFAVPLRSRQQGTGKSILFPAAVRF